MEGFFDVVNNVITAIDDFVWGVPLMVLILFGGILLTVRLGGLQFRQLPRALRYMVKNEKGGSGEVTSFGALCTALSERGITKLALGHHFDDAVETFLLSLVYEGRISCFQPVTHMTRTGVDQIRPMLYAGDGRIANLAKALALPIVENPCPEDRGSKRYEIKQFIRTMSQTYPDLRSKVFGAIQRAPLDGWEKAR